MYKVWKIETSKIKKRHLNFTEWLNCNPHLKKLDIFFSNNVLLTTLTYTTKNFDWKKIFSAFKDLVHNSFY